MPESLKNILLVMADGGYLTPPADHEKPSEIWEETWKRVDRFLPSLFQEVFPEVKASPPMQNERSAAGQGEPPHPPGHTLEQEEEDGERGVEQAV